MRIKHHYYSFLILLIVVAAVSCSRKKTDEINEDPAAYAELNRPLVHFSPKAHWMNDPNGMFYLDGEYHLFFQYYPDSTVWGPMHWGHAVSKDLVHWDELPIALYPDSLGYIFSGSAVVDTKNSSGLGTKENPPVVAIYTYHNAEREKAGHDDFQTQGMAYSLDKGRTWKKYEHNPVLQNPGIRDFRDPKVSWHQHSNQWVMTLAVTDHIEFYKSSDLKQWAKLSEFGKEEGEHGGVWECPDLFELKDENGNVKTVLFVSVNPGAPNGGSGTQYFIGHFDGTKFINDTPGKNSGWLDYGTDNYASVSFDNLPDRRVVMGWMTNWLYAQVMPIEGWRGANTLPRDLSLKIVNGKLQLMSHPAEELMQLAVATNTIVPFSGDTLDVRGKELPVTPAVIKGKIKASDFVMKLSNSKDQQVLIGLDRFAGEFYVDRSLSGSVDFQGDFKKIIRAPRMSTVDWIPFTLIVDAASIEVFFDDGATSITAINFPDENFTRLWLYSKRDKITTDTLTIAHLKGIW